MTFRRRLATLGSPPFPLTPHQLRMFDGIPGGAGAKVMNAWRQGKTPSPGYLKRTLAYFQETEERVKSPAWGADPKTLKMLGDLISKLQTYSEQVAQQAKSTKKPRKLSPLQQARRDILEGAEEYKRDAAAVIKRLGLTSEQAMGLAVDVLEDSNLSRESRILEEQVDYEQSGYSNDDVHRISQKTGWGTDAFGYIVAMMVALGMKGAAKRVTKGWATAMAEDE